MNDKTFLESPVFICGHRKSGTTLLLSLFDDHPELSVFPADSGFFYKYYPLCESNHFSLKDSLEVITNEIIGNFEQEYNKLTDADRKKVNFDIKKFTSDFVSLAESKSTPEDMLACLMIAFHDNYKHAGRKRWVEKTTSSEIYALDIADWFPDAKFIHLIRDPRDNWASLKSGWDVKYRRYNDSPQRLLQSLIERGKLGMEFAKHNQKILGDQRYKIIKFEELTNTPEGIMKDLCQFIGISFNEKLLKPTFLGVPWEGNNFDGLKFDSVSDVNAGRWNERIEENEAKLIEYYFADIMDHFGYRCEYTLKERVSAAKEQYKWHNYAQAFSYLSTKPT